jgi:hypothetical protein
VEAAELRAAEEVVNDRPQGTPKPEAALAEVLGFGSLWASGRGRVEALR